MSTKPVPIDEMSEADRARWARFDAEIQRGLDDVEAGRLVDADVVFDRIERRLKAMIAARRRTFDSVSWRRRTSTISSTRSPQSTLSAHFVSIAASTLLYAQSLLLLFDAHKL